MNKVSILALVIFSCFLSGIFGIVYYTGQRTGKDNVISELRDSAHQVQSSIARTTFCVLTLEKGEVVTYGSLKACLPR